VNGPGAGFGMTPTTIRAVSGDVAQLEEHRLCRPNRASAVLSGVFPVCRGPKSNCYLLPDPGAPQLLWLPRSRGPSLRHLLNESMAFDPREERSAYLADTRVPEPSPPSANTALTSALANSSDVSRAESRRNQGSTGASYRESRPVMLIVSPFRALA
jgi:hypothetical protein